MKIKESTGRKIKSVQNITKIVWACKVGKLESRKRINKNRPQN